MSTPSRTPHASDKQLISSQASYGDYYFLTPERDSRVAVVMGGKEICSGQYRIDRPGFRYHCVECVASGSGRLTLEGREFPLRPGALFAYGPGVAHRIEVTGDMAMTKYFVDFTGRRAVALLKEIGLREGRPLQLTNPPRVVALFEDLQAAASSGQPAAQRIASLQLELLLLQAGQLVMDGAMPDSISWRTYQTCRRAIEANFLGWRELSDVTEHCQISRPYLCRIFHRYHKGSPYQFLMQLKMAHAASLIVRGELLVKQVAAAVGFENPYHFSKAFRHAYKMSPVQFRRRHPRQSHQPTQAATELPERNPLS